MSFQRKRKNWLEQYRALLSEYISERQEFDREVADNYANFERVGWVELLEDLLGVSRTESIETLVKQHKRAWKGDL